MKLQGSCDSALGVAIDPFERLGLGVVVADVAHDLAFRLVAKTLYRNRESWG